VEEEVKLKEEGLEVEEILMEKEKYSEGEEVVVMTWKEALIEEVEEVMT
jgi:hypothetical protein